MIEVNNIVKVLPDGREILKGINFTVNKGDFVGILGPSGAGKTITMRCLNGLTKPTEGNIFIEHNKEKVNLSSCKTKKLRIMRQKIGMIFQGFNLVKRLSALDNVLIGKLGQINKIRSIFYGFTNQEAMEALKALEKVKITHLADRMVATLSGGEMQRVAIARAIYQDPIILLADEPIANLDPSNAVKIMKLLKPLAGEMPVIGVFHQPEIAAAFCNRIIAIKSGTVIYDGNNKLSDNLLEEIYGDELNVIETQPLQDSQKIL